MEKEKKYPWPMPTKEEAKKMIDDYFSWKRNWQNEVKKRYGRKQLHDSNMVAEDYAPYGNA